jgi:hypothetical protein
MSTLRAAAWLCLLATLALFTSSQASAGPLDPNAQRDAERIIEYLTNGRGSGQSWDKLATFVDTIGSRVSGSVALDNAVRYMLEALDNDGLENVHGEAVTIPNWVRICFTPNSSRTRQRGEAPRCTCLPAHQKILLIFVCVVDLVLYWVNASMSRGDNIGGWRILFSKRSCSPDPLQALTDAPGRCAATSTRS